MLLLWSYRAPGRVFSIYLATVIAACYSSIDSRIISSSTHFMPLAFA
jgi:Na+/pantothenate symporter